MDHATHNKIVSFIWSIADDCLRDVFVRGKYRDVILPMIVFRRIDCLLEDTKDAVLDPDGLREASGQVFYNISKFDLRNQIRKMAEADALHGVIEKFVAPDIKLSHHDAIGPDGSKLPGLTNLGMGYVFEELIRKFNEENNEEAVEHFTPREVIQLMIHLLFEPVKKKLPPVITIYDSACGSGGMLTKAQDFIIDPEGSICSKAAFDDFYTATSLTEPTDINVLHDLKDALDDAEPYSEDYIEKFNDLFFNGEDAEKLHPIIDETVARCDMIEDEEDKIDFKIKAKQFVKLYGQLACIMPFSKPEWERLHWFLKFLIPKLKVAIKDKDQLDELLESVDLSTYGLERVRLNQHLELDSDETELDPRILTCGGITVTMKRNRR